MPYALNPGPFPPQSTRIAYEEKILVWQVVSEPPLTKALQQQASL